MTKLPTKAEYDKTDPYEKGFMAYTYAKWPGSEIPEANPFERRTIEAKKFDDGVFAAMICAQDSEE